MKTSIFSTSLALALVSASPAFAQNAEIGHIVPSPKAAEIEREGTSSGDAVRRTALAYAQCTLRVARKAAIDWLNAGTDEEAEHISRRAFTEDCLEEGSVTMPPAIVRGALYSALYREQFGRKPPALTLQPLTPDQVPAASSDPTSQSLATVVTFADCVLRKDPAGARATVMSLPGSPEEAQGISKLMPYLSTCLARGTQMQLTKGVLVGVLAEALYRESVAATQNARPHGAARNE